MTVIALEEDLAHSTVSTILKDKERIRELMKIFINIKKAVITHIRQQNGVIQEMKKLRIL